MNKLCELRFSPHSAKTINTEIMSTMFGILRLSALKKKNYQIMIMKKMMVAYASIFTQHVKPFF